MFHMLHYILISVYLELNYFDSSLQGTGGWSNEGIIQDSDARSPVMCNSTHLTSFAVLVSSEFQGGGTFQVRNNLL